MPPADNENVELLLAEVKLEKKKKTILREPIEESAAEKKRVLQTVSEVGIRDKKRLHEQLIKYRNSMNEWKRKEKETQNQRGYHSRYNKMDNEPAFFNGISEQSQQRAFWILDALFCAVEELGGKVNADFSMRVMTDTVRIRIAEGQDKVKHELARQEARELVEYNDQIKWNKRASKPQIRKQKEEEVRRTKELLNQAVHSCGYPTKRYNSGSCRVD